MSAVRSGTPQYIVVNIGNNSESLPAPEPTILSPVGTTAPAATTIPPSEASQVRGTPSPPTLSSTAATTLTTTPSQPPPNGNNDLPNASALISNLQTAQRREESSAAPPALQRGSQALPVLNLGGGTSVGYVGVRGPQQLQPLPIVSKEMASSSFPWGWIIFALLLAALVAFAAWFGWSTYQKSKGTPQPPTQVHQNQTPVSVPAATPPVTIPTATSNAMAANNAPPPTINQALCSTATQTQQQPACTSCDARSKSGVPMHPASVVDSVNTIANYNGYHPAVDVMTSQPFLQQQPRLHAATCV